MEGEDVEGIQGRVEVQSGSGAPKERGWLEGRRRDPWRGRVGDDSEMEGGTMTRRDLVRQDQGVERERSGGGAPREVG